jgi:hypothetical protein
MQRELFAETAYILRGNIVRGNTAAAGSPLASQLLGEPQLQSG